MNEKRRFPIHSPIANGFQITIDDISFEKNKIYLTICDKTHLNYPNDEFSFVMTIDGFGRVFEHILKKVSQFLLDKVKEIKDTPQGKKLHESEPFKKLKKKWNIGMDEKKSYLWSTTGPGFKFNIISINTEDDEVELELEDTYDPNFTDSWTRIITSTDVAIDTLRSTANKLEELVQEEKEKKKTLRERLEELIDQKRDEHLCYLDIQVLQNLLKTTDKDE